MTRLSTNRYTVDDGSVSLLIENRNILEFRASAIKVCGSHNTTEIRGVLPLELALPALYKHRDESMGVKSETTQKAIRY